MIGKTLQTSLHIIAFVLFAVATLSAYVWFFPLGAALELGMWIYLGFYSAPGE